MDTGGKCMSNGEAVIVGGVLLMIFSTILFAAVTVIIRIKKREIEAQLEQYIGR